MAIVTSDKAAQFGESVIREMTRLFISHQRKSGAGFGVNLAQGFPDFPAPEEMKRAACVAIMDDVNQYAITWGAAPLRRAIAEKTHQFYGCFPDPDTQITVACGATECMIAALMAIVNTGDEVIVFEPFYENYWPDAVLSGAIPRFVTLHEPDYCSKDWWFDADELARAFNERTRAIIINTPHNPTGKMFRRDEMETIAAHCRMWNVVAITDEIYEHLTYDADHVRMADVGGMSDLTITISGLSKTFSATGWRIGWLIAPEDATNAIRKVHDFLTVGAPAPLQSGAVAALGFPDSYYLELKASYRTKRDFMVHILSDVGFRVYQPAGAYYIMTDIAKLGFTDDVIFARRLIEELGIATVPGSSFYRNRTDGKTKIRFCYCKKAVTLETAATLLERIPALNIGDFL